MLCTGRIIIRTLVASAIALPLGQVAHASGPDVSVSIIDGKTMQASWLGSDSDGVRLLVNESEVVVPLDELARIAFGPVSDPPAEGDAKFYLADGGEFPGNLLAAADDAVEVSSNLRGKLLLPFRDLAAIRLTVPGEYPTANRLFEETLADRSPSKDTLIPRDEKDVSPVEGRIESVGPDSGSFVFGERTRSFQTQKIYAIVFAAGAGGEYPQQVMATLTDSSRVGGKLIAADESMIRLEASFGETLELPLDRISELNFNSDRVVYLSTLEPTQESTEGLVHRPWPVRMDTNVAACPLAIDGRHFDRGIGTHSRTEISFDIGKGYESFAATIGIDDAVRPRGSVVFRVLGDGSVLFESETLTGADPPVDVLVPLKGVETITLVADYGDALDLSDYADWGGARIIRKR